MTTISSASFIYATLLAIGSSTDNFAVGGSLGISGKILKDSFNLFIAIFNAAGAVISSFGGNFLGNHVPLAAPILASCTFSYLCFEEIRSLRCGGGGEANDVTLMKAKKTSTSIRCMLQLALPMTLNNLAGGAAGGAVGISPSLAGASALVASYVMMKCGHMVGKQMGLSQLLEGRLDTRVVSAFIFGVLAVAQVM